MKEFRCSRCGTYLGEMSKGKIKKDTSLLCKTCMEFYKTCDSIAQASFGKGSKMSDMGAFGDLFGNMFGGKS